MTSSEAPPQFGGSEWLRYTRHIQLPQMGVGGQLKLRQSRVLVIGCGGLGCPVLLYLAAAGVGRLTLVDGDSVELTNLQRQVLYSEEDLGCSKAITAQRQLRRLNSDITVEAIDQPFTPETGEALVKAHDLIIDCTDNFATRYLINDLCVQWAKPWIFASVYQFSGQCALFTPGGPCFRCLFPDVPNDVPDCNTAGVLGVLPGMVGLFQANEAIKYLVGLTTPLRNTLLLVEALDLEFRQIKLRPNPQCVACGKHKKPKQLKAAYQTACETDISASSGKSLLISAVKFNQHRDDELHLVLDVRSIEERQAFHIGGDHVALAELSETLSSLSKDKTIICYCQSGVRSLQAAQYLRDAGFTAYSLAGGLAQWLQYQQKNGAIDD